MDITQNFQFAWPFFLLLIPVPLIFRYFVNPTRNVLDVLWMPYIDKYNQVGDLSSLKQTTLPILLITTAWILLSVASARPQKISEVQGLPISGRDLVIAVDLSESMRQTDFEIDNHIVTRLKACKEVANQFIGSREGDKIGLIVFGTQAYVQTPLTLDRETVQILLDETSIGLAGSKTAIGDAIGLAVKRLRKSDSDKRVLILMTDGANTAGKVEPNVAARLAASAGLRIYTIGIGSQQDRIEDEEYAVPDTYGLDEKTLKNIANQTGGKYYLASDTESLQGIYEEINNLEPVLTEGEQLYRYEELYFWPLALALMFILWVNILYPRY